MGYQAPSLGLARLKENKHLRRLAIITGIILVVQFYPQLLQGQPPEPFIVGLPWWYWVAFMTLMSMYLLISWGLWNLEKSSTDVGEEGV